MHHTQTRIYARSLELIDLSKQVMDGLPVGYGFIADQIRRASSSVVLNFAEGCGRSGVRDRRRFFGTARGSALEVAAAADVAQRFGVIETAVHAKLFDVCDHVSAMLYRYR